MTIFDFHSFTFCHMGTSIILALLNPTYIKIDNLFYLHQSIVDEKVKVKKIYI